MFKITINTRDVERELRSISEKQIPYALKEGVNAFAKDAFKREQKEMQRVFDRPTKFVVYGLRVTKWATKQDPSAEIGIKGFGGRSEAVEQVLRPHIREFENARDLKGMEEASIRIGYMRKGESLMPSRSFPLDRYGNVSKAMARRMLEDLGAQAMRASRKAGYVFGEVHGHRGRPVKGIWLVQGGASKQATGRWRLMMIVVSKRPSYAKRFDFYGVAQEYADKHLAEHVAAGMEKAMRTAR